MSRVAIYLIASLLAGCAALSPIRTEKAQHISLSSWQQLQNQLQDAPLEIRNAIADAAIGRLYTIDQTHVQGEVVSQDSRKLLVELLAHTQNPVLHQDAQFVKIQSVVHGINSDNYSYANAMADYLLQADYYCRQPKYAEYFHNRYSNNKSIKACHSLVPISVLTRYEGEKIVWLDPKRVKEIHLLFASKSESLASRFGHVALRLVICPEGKTSKSDCDINLFEHLVLGFRAHIDELSLNTIKALNGNYKAYLFANSFMDVYKEYAIDEFRDIYSLPLLLDEVQREAIVRELIEIHWSYSGEYSFFSRNCATMLDGALKEVWPDFAADEKMKSGFIRPDSLFEALKSSQLSSGVNFEDVDTAEHDGHFFSSTRTFYDRALAEVNMAMKSKTSPNLDEYLSTPPLQRRQTRFEDANYSARLSSDTHLREAQIMLEEYAALRSMRLFMIAAAKYFDHPDFIRKAERLKAELDDAHSKVFEECLILPIRQRYRPTRRLAGIPSPSEVSALPNSKSTCKSIESGQLLKEVFSKLKDDDSEDWQLIRESSQYWSESIDNLNLLKKM